MKILASGCSFTAGGPNAGENWPTMISRRNYVNNIAKSGAGNNYICQSTIAELCRNPGFYDLILIMWSGIQRHDIIISQSSYDAMQRNRINFGDVYHGMVGDAYSHSKNVELPLKELGQCYFKLSSEESLAQQTLINMLSLQGFLKSINISYRFFSYVNYWNDRQTITNLNFGLYKYQSCCALAEQIDFENFIFYNDQKDGLYEFAVEQKLLDADKFHPSLNGYRAWADFVKTKLEV